MARPLDTGFHDSLADTVSYSSVFRTVKAVVEGPPCNLLEAVAQSVASRILAEYDVEAVKITLKKPAAPIGGSILDYAAVQVMRADSSRVTRYPRCVRHIGQLSAEPRPEPRSPRFVPTIHRKSGQTDTGRSHPQSHGLSPRTSGSDSDNWS